MTDEKVKIRLLMCKHFVGEDVMALGYWGTRERKGRKGMRIRMEMAGDQAIDMPTSMIFFPSL